MNNNPGNIAIPLCLILGGILGAMNSFDIIHINHIVSLWPVMLIASGMEKLYIWTLTGDSRRGESRPRRSQQDLI